MSIAGRKEGRSANCMERTARREELVGAKINNNNAS
jgi:hypothetical protein